MLISGEEIHADAIREPLQGLYDALEKQDGLKILSEAEINEFFQSSTEGKVSYREGLLSVKAGDKVITYDAKAEKWLDIAETPTTGMQKSIGSVKLAFGVASTIVGLSVLSLFFIPLGFFPIAAIVGVFFGTSALNLANQRDALKAASEKAKVMQSDEEDTDLIKNLISSLSKNTRDALIKALGGEDKISEENIVLDLKTDNGELFEVKEGVLHINAGMLKYFLENGNVKNIMVVSFKIRIRRNR